MNEDHELSKLIQSHATRHTASERLRAAVRTQAALQAAAREAPRRWSSLDWRSVLAGFAAGATVAVAASWLRVTMNPQPGVDAQALALVDDHVHALRTGPLVVVASSDRHTVKPWFQGRLDYAPTVVDLSGQGFALLGGRVEQVNGTATAALIYERGHHKIEAYVWPATNTQAPRAQQIRGFNLLHWSEAGGMQVWLVSDIEAAELERLRQAWTGHRP